jgi:hypothetical protein
MTAPLPLRFYNPVKELCQKANLDYETVICKGYSPAMREVFLNADIPKSLDEIKSQDRKLIKHKKEFLDRKYGTATTGSTVDGETEDKGRIRYDMGVTVEHPLPDECEDNKPKALCDSVETIHITETKPFKYTRTGEVFVPGRGVIPRSEI